jgi:hypothetical protein
VKLKKKNFRRMCPWWFLFLAYGFSAILFIVSAFFIIVRGIESGDVKTQKWLISSVTGFFSSILFVQPAKVSEYLRALFVMSILDSGIGGVLRILHS